jgi:hypothetical protein
MKVEMIPLKVFSLAQTWRVPLQMLRMGRDTVG